jgi:hypothetical protein
MIAAPGTGRRKMGRHHSGGQVVARDQPSFRRYYFWLINGLAGDSPSDPRRLFGSDFRRNDNS